MRRESERRKRPINAFRTECEREGGRRDSERRERENPISLFRIEPNKSVPEKEREGARGGKKGREGGRGKSVPD